MQHADTSVLDDPSLDRASWPDDGSYRPFDRRDGPEADYVPCFVQADQATYDDDTIVIGIDIDGSARAYARAQLIARPVNDHIGEIPLLVAY